MFKVVDIYTGEVVRVFDTYDAAEKWVLSNAEILRDGRRIYRTWTENDIKFYDVGRVFYIVS